MHGTIHTNIHGGCEACAVVIPIQIGTGMLTEIETMSSQLFEMIK